MENKFTWSTGDIQIVKASKNAPETHVEHVHSHNHLEDDDYINLTLEHARNALGDDMRDRVFLGEQNVFAAAQRVEADMVNAYILAVQNGNFDEANRIITASEEKRHINEFETALKAYYLVVYPVYAQQLMRERAGEFEKQGVFSMTASLEKQIDDQAKNAAESHINTVQKDLEGAIAVALHEETEKALIELVRQGAEARNAGILKKLPENPNIEDITKAVKAGEFNENPIYKRARELAREGNGLDAISRALKREYDTISRNRARTIARHETNRVFNMAQYQADLQFLTESGLMDNAYKVLHNRANDPCPFCEKLINQSEAHPIPFQQNFADLGTTLTATYEKANGQRSVRSLPINYEAISAGNVHVNCRCEYVLKIKQPDGSFLNNVDTRVFNKSGGNPNHGKDGKFATGTGHIVGNSLQLKHGSKSLSLDLTDHEKALFESGGVTARLISPSEDPSMKTIYGDYDPATKVIRLNADRTDHIQSTFYHELGHAADGAGKDKITGVDTYPRNMFKSRAKSNPHAVEKEAIVAHRLDEALQVNYGLSSKDVAAITPDKRSTLMKGGFIVVNKEDGGFETPLFLKRQLKYMQQPDEVFADAYSQFRNNPTEFKQYAPNTSAKLEELTQ